MEFLYFLGIGLLAVAIRFIYSSHKRNLAFAKKINEKTSVSIKDEAFLLNIESYALKKINIDRSFIFKSNQIIYVEPEYNTEVNGFLSRYYAKLKEQFSFASTDELDPFEIIYLNSQQENSAESQLNSTLKYNHPYLSKEDFKSLNEILNSLLLDSEDFARFLAEEYGLEIDSPGLVRFLPEQGIIEYIRFEETNSSYLIKTFIKYRDTIRYEPPLALFSIRDDYHPDPIVLSDVRYKKRLDTRESEQEDVLGNQDWNYFGEAKAKCAEEDWVDIPDEDFDSLLIEEEIQKKIDILIATGKNKIAISIALEILNRTKNSSKPKLSRLRVTKDFKLILEDYGNTEIRLTPLQKTLYILFLKYPEGILLKNLMDYKQEVVSIYLTLTNRESIDSVMESIDKLVDPFNNSINEKASRIKEAFISEFIDDIAKNYYLTGVRGKPKKVNLSRKLLIWEPTEIIL